MCIYWCFRRDFFFSFSEFVFQDVYDCQYSYYNYVLLFVLYINYVKYSIDQYIKYNEYYLMFLI